MHRSGSTHSRFVFAIVFDHDLEVITSSMSQHTLLRERESILELSFPRDIFLPSFSFISTVKTVFSGRNFYRSSAYQVYYFVSGSYSGN